jgi:penicillin amidase
MDSIRVDDFKEMQMDNFSYHAYRVLPPMLESLPGDSLTNTEQQLVKLLNEWNYQNEANAAEPTLFYYWWQQLYGQIWDNKYNSPYPMRRPGRDLTADLIVQIPGSGWFDDVHTTNTETLADLSLNSFRSAVELLESRYGTFLADWQWGNVRNTNLSHLAQIPGMGVRNLFTGGGAESINAIRGDHGPSWRMIVELDPEGVRGYGVYPGGQSGNPGSKTYDQFIETWRTGELYELQFLRNKPQQRDSFPLMIRFE